MPAGGLHGEPEIEPGQRRLGGTRSAPQDHFVRVIGLVLGLIFVPCVTARGDIILNFSDVPPGTLAVLSPYTQSGVQPDQYQRRVQLQQS